MIVDSRVRYAAGCDLTAPQLWESGGSDLNVLRSHKKPQEDHQLVSKAAECPHASRCQSSLSLPPCTVEPFLCEAQCGKVEGEGEGRWIYWIWALIQVPLLDAVETRAQLCTRCPGGVEGPWGQREPYKGSSPLN